MDALDSLPRLRLSNAQMNAVMFVMREAGVVNVPSVKTLRRIQQKLRDRIAIPSIRKSSILGNVFYVNDICEQVARVRLLVLFVDNVFLLAINKDFANPFVRRHLQLYPHRTSGFVSEACEADRWAKEMDSDQLSPMVIGPRSEHFYVHELAITRQGLFLIPLKWIYVDQQLCGDCWEVKEIVCPMSFITYRY